jgi:hypothetical protein
MIENVTDYGAVGDGSTDDTQAINDAADAAGPGGTVYFPAGTYLVGSNTRYPFRYPMDGSWDNLTWEGEEFSSTTLLMAGDQPGWHMMFLASSDGGYQTPDIRFEHLTMDMNQANQSHEYGSHWCKISDGSGTVTMRDCVVENTVNAGIVLESDMAGDIRYCHFRNCGDPEASAGHAINPVQSSEQTTNVEYCLIEDSAGTDVDIGHARGSKYQTVNIHRCYFNAGRGALKLAPENVKTTVTNTAIVAGSRTTIPVKANASDHNCGALEMQDVLIDGGGWPGVDIATGGFDTLTMDQVAIKNVCTDSDRDAGMFTNSADFNGGTISIHDVGSNNSGDAVWFTDDASGSISEIRHDGTSGLGQTSSLSVGTNAAGGSEVTPDVPSASDVGPRSSDSSNDSTDDSTSDSTTYGGYNTPESGTVDWHIPLNENFNDIEADIVDLADRVQQFEGN